MSDTNTLWYHDTSINRMSIQYRRYLTDAHSIPNAIIRAFDTNEIVTIESLIQNLAIAIPTTAMFNTSDQYIGIVGSEAIFCNF